MKRLLIVEDEKLIRQGINVMVKRSDVNIEEILECKNGEEAYKILNDVKVDVMITDVRMPKMDGIELVKKIQNLEDKPQIIVVSGYDEFNYAVEALRQGVREYILKPIEREKINAILVKINEELEDKKAKSSVIKQIENQQLKYLILNQKITEEEIHAIEKQFSTLFFKERYLVCQCNSSMDLNIHNEKVIVLKDADDYFVIIADEEELSSLLKNELKNYSVGISKVHEGIRELREGYLESIHARKEAFVKCVSVCYYQDKDYKYETVPDNFADHFVQLFGTAKIDGSLSKLSRIQYNAKNNKISPEKLLEVTEQILIRLIETYQRIIEFDMMEFNKLKDPLHYKDSDEYFSLFFQWIRRMQQVIIDEFNDYRNKEKINTAVRYIHENYSKNLNMAVVSNYISMNYSLFSLNFKEYTGMNFVNYLKKIRIDEAKKLLQDTEEKVLDISQAVGYDNEKSFMKVFKSVCGVSPTEYRKNIHMGKKERLRAK
ncbi:MAG: response regulator [Anaerocolumna aminovalerica]|uniref:response regulator transcription factor n=1 Tax=Anaerocolumna aminovalerica TaxID=1527 RepID=UPI00290B5349|nr:response regulator [Anaerocolumna aminovalerica]MDU6262966.1 response regulator [Anaerocolumna aminovalerica]